MKAKIRFAKIRSTHADHDNKLAIELMNDQGNMIADIAISTEDFARIVFTGGEIPAEIIRGWSANLAWYLAQHDLTAPTSRAKFDRIREEAYHSECAMKTAVASAAIQQEELAVSLEQRITRWQGWKEKEENKI